MFKTIVADKKKPLFRVERRSYKMSMKRCHVKMLRNFWLMPPPKCITLVPMVQNKY